MNDDSRELLQSGGLILGALLLGLLIAWFVLNVQKPDVDARSLHVPQQETRSP